MNIKNWEYSKGKKKNSTAKVYIKKGKGSIIINKIDINNFKYKSFKEEIFKPLNIINKYNFDIKILKKGGGIRSQIKATIIAISRALSKINIQFKKLLKKHKLINSDTRIVEKKKTGFVKSRKKHQFSKR